MKVWYILVVKSVDQGGRTGATLRLKCAEFSQLLIQFSNKSVYFPYTLRSRLNGRIRYRENLRKRKDLDNRGLTVWEMHCVEIPFLKIDPGSRGIRLSQLRLSDVWLLVCSQAPSCMISRAGTG